MEVEPITAPTKQVVKTEPGLEKKPRFEVKKVCSFISSTVSEYMFFDLTYYSGMR